MKDKYTKSCADILFEINRLKNKVYSSWRHNLVIHEPLYFL